MMIYVIADTHFGHRMLDKYREPNFEGKYIEKWNQIVRPIDTVIHLGDFSLGNYPSTKSSLGHRSGSITVFDVHYSLTESIVMWRNQLTGSVILIRGNHDKQPNLWYANKGFTVCAEKMVLKIKGKNVLFSHEPQTANIEGIDINIHGHLHGNTHRLEGELAGYPWNKSIQYIDVSNLSEYGYVPILIDSLIPDR